ncbi:MAG: hypothetical protein JNL32_10730 [Candidatus Kapabacteria bacterium]|nr:hypothetical protein [Candidatus Kapabacteria bacterium]
MKKTSTSIFDKYITWIPFVSGITLIAIWVLWLCYPTQYYQDAFDRYGSFISGLLGTVLGTANIIILIRIWNEQSHLSAVQNTEQMFFNLLTVRLQLLQNVKYKSENDEYAVNLIGQSAIIQMAKDITNIQSEHNNIKFTSLMKDYYKRQSEHLRHYIDYTLDMFEYVDKQHHLSKEQRTNLIRLAVDAFSYDESLVFTLVSYDYDSPRRSNLNGEQLPTQLDRLNVLNAEYDVLYRLVYENK